MKQGKHKDDTIIISIFLIKQFFFWKRGKWWTNKQANHARYKLDR